MEVNKFDCRKGKAVNKSNWFKCYCCFSLKINKNPTKSEEKKCRERERPNEIDAQREVELEKEVIELAEVSSIAMGVKQSEAGVRVSQIKSNDLVPPLCVNHQHVQGFVIRRNSRQRRGVGGGRCCYCAELAVALPLLDLVGRWRWRKEGKFRCYLRQHAPHSIQQYSKFQSQSTPNPLYYESNPIQCMCEETPTHPGSIWTSFWS